MREIRTSATAAVRGCTAGATGTQCGLKWTQAENDGSLGVGEQMAAMEIFQSNLVDKAPGFVSAQAGTGTSVGDPSAGTGSSRDEEEAANKVYSSISTGDKVGAGILTALVLMGVIGGSATMIMSE